MTREQAIDLAVRNTAYHAAMRLRVTESELWMRARFHWLGSAMERQGYLPGFFGHSDEAPVAQIRNYFTQLVAGGCVEARREAAE